MVRKKKESFEHSSKESVDGVVAAAKQGSMSLVKGYIEDDKRLLNSGHGPNTLLKCAIGCGETEIVKYLVGFKELDVNLLAAKITKDSPTCKCCVVDDIGPFPPLFLAAVHGHLEIVKLLLGRQEIKINFREPSKGLTALSIAAATGHTEVVKLMFQDPRIDVNVKTEKGTDLHSLAINGCANGNDVKMAKLFINNPDIKVNDVDLEGFTPLHYAAQRGKTRIVERLLAHKNIEVNAHVKNKRDHRVPLQLAIQESELDIAKLFLKHADIDVNIKDGDSWSLLHVAFLSYKNLSVSIAIIKLLLTHKDINVNCKAESNNNGTPFYWAACKATEDRRILQIVKLLLEHGVDANAVDSYGQSPLMCAASYAEGIDVVKVLLNYKGLDLRVNYQTPKYGATAFCMACRLGHTQIVKVFLECKLGDIDFDLASHDGNTPLKHAIEGRHSDIVRLLLERQRVERAVERPLPTIISSEKDVKKQKKELRRKKEALDLKELEKELNLDVLD